MTRYYLGVDVGGTKSHALVADETGRALGLGEGGPGNPEGVGWDGLAATLSGIVEQAISSAGIRREQIAGAGYGIAGYDWPSERASTVACIQPLGIDAPYEIVNDALVGLLAGSPEGWGVALVAGTGTNCWGWDRERRQGRVTGHGIPMGEFGGATELMYKAVHAINAQWTMRGPATALSPAFVSFTGAADLPDLIEGLCVGRYDLDAAAAPLVFQAAASGDQVAREVITWAASELGGLAVGVIRQLQLEALDFDVVLVGSLHDNGPIFTDPLRQVIHAAAPGARFIRLDTLPVVGGVLLGMEMAGLQASLLRDRLVGTARALRQRQGSHPMGS